ncbi:MAG: response regulator transcription factor [Opitutaceae bacterium]|nr:response regulator transcription factor [Verrucomicrobiales bacterium]
MELPRINSSTKPVRVILADDHTLVRAGIRALLEKLPHVTVVAEANDGREALELVKAQPPDVVVLDVAMPGLNGLEAADRISKEFPDVRVVILSMHDNEEYVWRALKAGATGYLLKKAATIELEAALQSVLRGEVYLSREISQRLPKTFLLDGLSRWKNPLEQLTGRQREILQLMVEGRNTKEIADILKLSTKTVEYHRLKLMDSLNVRDIAGLVRLALRGGLIPPES